MFSGGNELFIFNIDDPTNDRTWLKNRDSISAQLAIRTTICFGSTSVTTAVT